MQNLILEECMALLKWNPAMESGHQAIDGQHQQLAELINQLDDAITSGRDVSGIINLVLHFQATAQTHFLVEDDLMEQCHYPGAKAHQELHRVLSNQLSHLVQSLEEDPSSISRATGKTFHDWFLTHLNGDDRRLAEFLLSRYPCSSS